MEHPWHTGSVDTPPCFSNPTASSFSISVNASVGFYPLPVALLLKENLRLILAQLWAALSVDEAHLRGFSFTREYRPLRRLHSAQEAIQQQSQRTEGIPKPNL